MAWILQDVYTFVDQTHGSSPLIMISLTFCLINYSNFSSMFPNIQHDEYICDLQVIELDVFEKLSVCDLIEHDVFAKLSICN